MNSRIHGLTALLAPTIQAMDYEFWGLELLSDGGGSLLRIYIDHAQGINLDDCERVSVQVAGILDVEDPIAENYRLEVSSPGLDRPLFDPAHFARFVGHAVKVRLRRKIQDRRKIVGTIAQVTDNSVVISAAESDFTIAFNAIDKANLVYEPVTAR